MTTIASVEQAAQTYWKTDTTGKGHLSRGAHFYAAREDLISQGYKKGEAQKIIAETVRDNAPAHEKKFGAPTVSHYVSSYALFQEDTCQFNATQANADLYAAVHKAYAASMGVDNLRNILSVYTEAGDAINAINALTRPGKDEDGKGGGRGQYGLKHALAALAKIQEHEWTDDEKSQLFAAALATSVAVQVDFGDDE